MSTKIEKVAVLGAGVMGAQIAGHLANAGIPSYLFDINDELVGAIITPDKDIIENSENLKPAYIVFENYEKILNWNRSLRFALAVCTLKDKFKNVL